MPDVKFSNQYPYTDFHELNLDWVIKEVKYWSTKVGKTIQSIELTGTAGLVDTYTINYSDGTASTFDVTNGNGITSVAKTGTAGLVDTYTITFQNGNTSTFDVTNGAAAVDPTLTLPDYAADAKATGDALSVIRSDVERIDDNFIYHLLNGFDVNNVVSGYYNSSGNIAADSNYRSSQTYAIVYPGTVYNCYYNSGLGQYTVAAWYDADKVFISRNAGNGISFTAPAGAAYVRVSVPAANIATSIFTEYAFTQYYSFGYAVKLKTDRLPGETALNPLYGKKLAVTGDSICYGEGYVGGYAKIIGINNNMTVQNIGISGGTVVKKTGYFCISESIANMAADADYAIIEGGFNDAASGSPPPLGTIATGYNAVYDTTTFYGAFETMLRDLLIRFQGKKIGYIAVHQATNNYRVVNDPATSYYWAARKCCEKWGIPFCDLNTLAPAFGYFTATNADMLAIRNAYTKTGDGIHPNEAGYTEFYVPKIEAWLKTL